MVDRHAATVAVARRGLDMAGLDADVVVEVEKLAKVVKRRIMMCINEQARRSTNGPLPRQATVEAVRTPYIVAFDV